MFSKVAHTLRWLPAYGWQRLVRRGTRAHVHLMIAVADHFEPSFLPQDIWGYANPDEQERRVERWCRERPRILDRWRDSDGRPFRHTFFYPAEQYDADLIDRLAEHCHAGWGEIEVHLHHGRQEPDSPENTRTVLLRFVDALGNRGCLSRWNGKGPLRYGFVHGNWALANSANGRFCGVDSEMQILAETGCYADFTLPSAPDPTQGSRINSIYECSLPLRHRAPHRRGRPLRQGRPPQKFPIIVQGPLALNFQRRVWGLPSPQIENGALTAAYPPTMHRMKLWRKTAITVNGRPDWIVVKLHCHGMNPVDEPAMLGAPLVRFLRELTEEARTSNIHSLHFVSARELVNIVLAACDGREGNPNDFRDYRLKPLAPTGWACGLQRDPFSRLDQVGS